MNNKVLITKVNYEYIVEYWIGNYYQEYKKYSITSKKEMMEEIDKFLESNES